jgi:hypothetical protein
MDKHIYVKIDLNRYPGRIEQFGFAALASLLVEAGIDETKVSSNSS